MDSKILYTNDNAELQCVAVKSIETVRNASAASRGGRPSSGAAAQRTPLSSSSDAVFLLPHESFYSYLYIGAADGTLLALRFQVFLKELAVPGNGLTYEHRVALEAQSKVVITAPNLSAVATRSRSSKARSRHGQESPSPSPTTTTPSATLDTEAAAAVDAAALRGVRAIYAPMELPYLFLLVHGCFQVHEDDTLQLLGLEYTASLGLVDATVLLLCAGEEQSAAARRRRRPTRSSDRRGVPSDGSVSSDTTTAAYYALLLDSWAVVLVECTKTTATRLRFLDGAAVAAGWSDEDAEAAQHAALSSSSPPQSQSRPTPRRAHLADTLLPVQPHTCTMAWCGDALITGSPEYYRLYDTLYGTVLSQLDVSTLLGGCAPFTGYVRTAAVDPSRVGFELAAESAEVCSYSDGSLDRGSSSSSSSSSSSGGDSSSSESNSSAGERQLLGRRHAGGNCGTNAASMGWPSALVFRLRDGELHVCAGAGRADLTDAAPLVSGFGAVQEVHSCPPFLLCQRGGSDGGEDGGQSSRSSTSSRIRASLAELRRASQQLSAKLAESRRPAKQCEMILFSCLDGQPWTSPEMEPVTFMSVNLRGVQAFPLGLLGVSRHVVEALLWKPFAAQLEDQVETGHYARALRFVSQCFRGSEASRRVVLRQVCQASATRAMSRRRYRVAFYFYTLADTGVDSLLRLFPELQRPASTPTTTRRHSKDDSAPAAAAAVVVAATASGSLGAAKSGSRSRSRSRDASFAERHMRQFSYASPAPYRALYRILLSQFFSLVASAATVVDSPANDPAASSPSEPPSRCGSEAPVARGGSQSPTAATGASPAPRGDEPSTFPPSLPVTPPAQGAVTATRDTTTTGDTVFVPISQPTTPAEAQTDATPSPSWSASHLSSATSACALAETSRAAVLHTRANVEFALFCLFAIDYAGARRLRTTRDELLQFMVSVRTLSRDDCASVVAALGLPPQSLLSALLLAATGNYDQALARCRDDGDVAAAGATLAMYARTPDATSAQLERLYQLQLPWMLEADPPTAVRLLTTPARFAGEKPGPAALLPVLLTVGGTVLLDYLSYLINTECCVEAVVHQLYAMQLIHTLQTLREEWGLQGFASAELGAADGAGTETGLVGRVRRALFSFLQCSPLYDKERVLARLVEADLHEEQCVVLEALEDHIGVLTTLVYAMRDMDRAVRYCEAHYTQDRDHAHQSLPLADLLHRSASRSSTTTITTTAAAADRAPLLRTFEEGQEGGRTSSTAWAHDGAPPQFSTASTVHETFDRTVEGALDVVPLFPSRDCQRVASSEAAAMAHYTHEAVDESAVAPSRVAAWHPIMRFNPYLHMLLHVLLIPPTGREVALSEIIWLLSTYSPYMSPRLVLLSLPGDVPLPLLAPYLIRAFQRLELNHQLVCMEAAAVQNAVSDAVRRHVTLQQRCVWVDDHHRCVVCGEPLEKGGLVVVFPNLKPAHFRCHQDGSLDPERAVPFLGNLA